MRLRLIIFCITAFCMWSCLANKRWDSVANHSVWSRLDELDCGQSAADRIIGGFNASLGQFPWIIRIGYTTPDMDELDFMCGGALVTDRHVVTAAHCITSDDEIQLKLVRLGEYNTLTDPDCQFNVCAPPVQDVKVKRIVLQHKFDNPVFHNDIAIIELETPAGLNDYVTPICLPRQDQLRALQDGELVTVAGWGKMNMTTEERATLLQYIALPMVSPKACDTRAFRMSEAEICAGAVRNKDACGGDSGGPLMKVYDTPEGPKTFLIGVVSFGPTICGIKKPGVYSSVAHFLGWILDNIY